MPCDAGGHGHSVRVSSSVSGATALGLGFLATIRKDGGPRVHPVCPVISEAGLHVLILPGPKPGDLRRDGRYSLHSETVAPPREDDGFAVTGASWQNAKAVLTGYAR
jgi:hypothetical protein